MKIAVLTDSTAYLSDSCVTKYNIHVVSLSVAFEGEGLVEDRGITPKAFYEKMNLAKELPKTSQPPLGVILSTLEEISKDYDVCICVHLSSGISGTYQSVTSAGSMVEGLKVHTFDSEISAMPQGFYVLEAARMIEEGASVAQIMDRLNEIKEHMKAYFMVDDLGNLQKGGRLSSAQAIVGSLLQVKPILHFQDKVIVPFEKIRTRKKALTRIMSILETDAEKDLVEKVAFIHANNLAGAQALEADFKVIYPQIETVISHFSPVIGTHLGEGALGIGWYTKA